MKQGRWTSVTLSRAGAAALLIGVAVTAMFFMSSAGAAAPTQAALPLCKTINTPKDVKVSRQPNLAVVQQGYRCILRHYVTAARLDDRVLLRGAFDTLTQALGTYATGITLSPLTGNRDADWRAFATAYDAVAARFKLVPIVQQLLAEASLQGMANSLHDDHTAYLQPSEMKAEIAQLNPDTPAPTLGVVTSPITNTTTSVYITDVFPGTPAAAAGLQPGDTVAGVNGQPLFQHGQPNAGLFSLLLPQLGHSLQVAVVRPRTGARFTVTLTPRSLITPATTARVVAGTVAYVKLYAFTTNAATQVFTAIRHLGLGASLTGLILDLRGNGGGAADQAVRIVSALTHNVVVGYQVNGRGHRDAQRTDNKVSLLRKPVVVLIDGGSASSSEVVAGAVRDYHLGTIVGTRSAGALAAAEFFGLSDGSGLEITEDHVLGALGEQVDGIGIAPNQQVATTAAQLSAGHDPVVDQAVRDIRQATAPR